MKVSFKLTGLDDLQKRLEQFGERARSVSGETYTVSQLVELAGLSAEWLAGGPEVPVTSIDALAASPEWNDYVRRTTTFESVEEMLQHAVANRVRAKVFG